MNDDVFSVSIVNIIKIVLQTYNNILSKEIKMFQIKTLIDIVETQAKNFNSFFTNEAIRNSLDNIAKANAEYARQIWDLTEKSTKYFKNQVEEKWESFNDKF